MSKYRVLWVEPKPSDWVTYEDDLDRDKAWEVCQERWENGYTDARVEEAESKAASWVIRQCKFARDHSFTV